MTALALLLIAPDVDRLGSPDWPTREAAHDRLGAWGLLAVPALLEARGSDDPEVRARAADLLAPWRSRAADLLAPWRSRAADLLAAAALCTPFPPAAADDLRRWFGDDQFRRRLHRLARAGGVPEWEAYRLLPEADSWCWFGHGAVAVFGRHLEGCRARLGYEPGWFFSAP